MTDFASSDHVQFGMISEAVKGIFEVSAAFPIVLTTGILPDFVTNIIQDPTISGEGEAIDARTNMRALDLQTPAVHRFGDNKFLISAALRDVFVAPVTVVGSSDINFLTGGTHLDGSTGPQITAPTTAFDTLINYGGVTSTTNPSGGAESLMMLTSGSASSENNGLRRIKAVHDTGSLAAIDIWPGYVGGAAGTFGEPIAGTTLESITIKVGTAARNRFIGAGVKSWSALWYFSDIGKWQNGWGLRANDLTLAWSGIDGATIDIPWIGQASGGLVNSDPSSQGFDATVNLYSPMLNAADDLLVLAVVTASEPIVLSALSLTGFSGTLAGNSEGIGDVSGSSERVGVRQGGVRPTGTLDWHLTDDVRAEKLTNLGAKGTSEKAGIDVVFLDPDGNYCIWGMLWNEFSQSGPVPGGENSNVDGSIAFSGHRRTNQARSWAYQEIAA